MLETLFATYGDGTNARYWVGQTPRVSADAVAAAIAAQVGYPTFSDNLLSHDYLVKLDRAQAAHVLAVAGRTSLAYGKRDPARAQVERAAGALDTLSAEALFWSNGLWDVHDQFGWNPLTTATFDCGLIGRDAQRAFIFWVEEED